MQLIIGHCVPILLITMFTTWSESADPVKVKLHDSATLSCSERCSGLVRWTVFSNPSDALAECDQTSCRSKEGYQMIHDQYLKGNLSLIITDADFTKRGWYTCQCDGKDLCDVRLQIELSESADPPVKVKLHDSATLPCYERCSGSARWTVFHKHSDTLAECDQTSCRSVKEGYQMIHDQYLKGNLSLIITDTDFSKRDWYTCDCDGKDVCDVHLQIEPLNTTVEIMAGESLILRVDVSDAVDLIYNSAGTPGPSSGEICAVDGPSLQCKPEYTQRASLTSGLQLRRMTPSDSGVYIIMDSRNKEVIHTYTVTVQAVQDSEVCKRAYEKGNSDGYQTGVGIGALAVGSAALVIMIVGFVLGVFAAPRVRPLMDSCVQTLRSNDSSNRNQSEDRETGTPLASVVDIQS